MPPIPSRQALRHLARLCQLRETTAVRKTATPTYCNQRTALKYRTSSSHQLTQNKALSTSSRLSDQQDRHQSAAPLLPDITNFYTLFSSTIPNGPPSASNSSSSFSIHLPSLRKEFLRLQSLHHPDKYDPSTPAHQKALALSSLINNAYRTLSDPLLRAQYLLQLEYDIDVTSEDNSAHPTDQETLMEVMEAQETIEEATGQEEIDTLKTENEGRINRAVDAMGKAFENGNADAAKAECVKLKYWRSLQQGLQDWEPGKEVRLVH